MTPCAGIKTLCGASVARISLVARLSRARGLLFRAARMNSNGPRILLIGSTYRAVCVLERLLERGDRVVAFIGVEGGARARSFCPEILELCDRAGIPARSGQKLGEEIVRWLEDRIRPDLAIGARRRNRRPASDRGKLPARPGRDSRLLLEPRAARASSCASAARRCCAASCPSSSPASTSPTRISVWSRRSATASRTFLDRLAPAREEAPLSVPFEGLHDSGGRLSRLIARPDPGAETEALEREVAEYLGADRVLALRSPGEAFLALSGATRSAKRATR